MATIYQDDEEIEKAKESKQKEKSIRDQELDDLKKVLSTKEGRRLIWRILNDNCILMGGSAHASGSHTYLNEGRRVVGLEIYREINDLDPQLWGQMHIEMKG